jgi:hypothetical protein
LGGGGGHHERGGVRAALSDVDVSGWFEIHAQKELLGERVVGETAVDSLEAGTGAVEMDGLGHTLGHEYLS